MLNLERQKIESETSKLAKGLRFFRIIRLVSNTGVRFLTLSLGAFLVASDLHAANTTYGLPDLLERAEKNAILKNEADAMRRQALAKLSEVEGMRWVPEFNLRVLGGIVPDAKLGNPNDVNSYQPNSLEEGYSFSHTGGFLQLQINAVQPIYTFGKISNYVDMAEKNVLLSQFESVKKRNEIKLLVKRAYYTLQFATDSGQILEDVQNRLDEASEKVEKLLIKNADNVSEIDRLKIGVFSADVRNRRLDADRAQRLSRSALAELCGVTGDWNLDQMSLSSEVVSHLTKEDAIGLALRSKPELNQLAQGIQIKQAERRAIRSDLFPTFFAGGKLEYAKAPGRTDVSNPYLNDPFNSFDAGIALGMKQDLGVWRTLSKMDGLQAEVDRLSAQREQLLVRTKLEAEKSFEEAVSATEAQRINEDGFRAARSWLTAAGLSFNLGTADTKDVLESFAAYFKARVDLVKSIYTLNSSLSDLALTVGSEILDRLKAQTAPAVEASPQVEKPNPPSGTTAQSPEPSAPPTSGAPAGTENPAQPAPVLDPQADKPPGPSLEAPKPEEKRAPEPEVKPMKKRNFKKGKKVSSKKKPAISSSAPSSAPQAPAEAAPSPIKP